MQISKLYPFIVVASLVTVVFVGLVTIPAAAQTDTMQFRYNAAHTGDYSSVAGNVQPNYYVKWHNSTNGGDFSSPTVANGVVYVGGWDGVYAFNSTTGVKVWNYTTGSNVKSSPAVANGIVYVGVYVTNGLKFCALNASTGAFLWGHSIGYFVFSSPAVANGVVYVVSNNYPINAQRSDADVYAFNATTGANLWVHKIGGWTNASPAVSEGLVFIGCEDGKLYALNASTGASEWTYATGPPNPDFGDLGFGLSSPAVANGVVYVGNNDDGNLYALDAMNGAKLWSYKIGDSVETSPAVANGVVYIGPWNGYGGEGGFYALDAATGALKWRFPLSPSAFVGSSAAVANGVVYVVDSITGGDNGTLYALDALNGALIWQDKSETLFFTSSSPAVVDGIIYIQSGVGEVYAIGTQGGTPTTLKLSAPSLVAVNNPFSFSGSLSSASTPIAGATVQLQKNVSGTWTDVADKTNTTTANGGYLISTREPIVSTYQYRVIYAGNVTYANATSTSVTVKVVSKASVLADIDALKATVNALPASAFLPGTQTAFITVLDAARLQVTYGKYADATATLQTKLVPRINSCLPPPARPDTNHWMRDCAAQRQLYPQVQNLIQELKALQGS